MAGQIAVDVRVRAKLPRWFPAFLRAVWLLRYLGWKPSDGTASRIAAWVARHSDVEVLEGAPKVRPADQDNSPPGLARLP
jgi:hypothetical protein